MVKWSLVLYSENRSILANPCNPNIKVYYQQER